MDTSLVKFFMPGKFFFFQGEWFHNSLHLSLSLSLKHTFFVSTLIIRLLSKGSLFLYVFSYLYQYWSVSIHFLLNIPLLSISLFQSLSLTLPQLLHLSLSLSLSISPSLFLAHTYSQWHGPCLSVCLSHYLFSFLKFGLSFPVKILGSTVYSSFSQSHSHLRPLNV